MITIFTDGSSRGNPGPGGWAAIIATEHGVGSTEKGALHVKEIGGYSKETTNNRMELTAAVKGIEAIPNGEHAVLYTDSSYVINGITKWIKGWKNNGWMTKTKEEVLNRDLWEELDGTIKGRTITWKYVGGHVGILGNERCDHIATDFADGNNPNLYNGPINGYDLPNILDISHDELLQTDKKSKSSRSKAAAYSYVSSVGGTIEIHKTWAECEKRVKGKKGVRYKKALSAEDEALIMGEFS